MSILIKGMEMPTCCCWCQFCRKTYTEWGSIYSADCIIKKMPIKFSELDLRDGLCPLAEVPPHGRLIDADVLISQYKGNIWTAKTDYAEGLRDVVADIKAAHTVIPADNGRCTNTQ